MSIEKVRTYLKQFNADNRIIEFATSSATVELAAQAAGCEPARIAKTLSFKLHDDSVMLVFGIIYLGIVKVDNACIWHYLPWRCQGR